MKSTWQITRASPKIQPDSGFEHLSTELATQLERVLRQLEQGEPVDVERLKREHPEIADELEQCVANLQFIEDIASLFGGESDRDVPGSASSGLNDVYARIGDYRIIRELGRGGMGVVYEAEQLSLRRNVALKILPYAAVLDKRALQRFHNEVTAAAQLDHPNIVDVYAVGCDRGVHHFAMKLIDGCSLYEIIRQLRRMRDSQARFPASILSIAANSNDKTKFPEVPDPIPAESQSDVDTALQKTTWRSQTKGESASYFRSVAEFGAAVAGALDFAHQRGIVHRDVKPSNLMIDNAGKAWIADFGLAQIETGTALTRTGDLLGTARYMSPEQIEGKRIILDHRTDIYSLGVTLYELLTLQLPFEADNRQELFRQILLETPKSPREIQPAIPVDLETIVLKAMEKSAADRYQTAAELADDLQRFANLQPIQARRPTRLQRIRKWTLRHPAFAYSTITILLVLTMASLVSTLLIWQAKVDAQNERNVAKDAKQLAEQRLLLAKETVDEMYTRVAEDWLKQRQLSSIQKELLEKAAAFYEQFAQRDSIPNDQKFETAMALQRLGRIRITLKQLNEATTAIDKGISILTELIASDDSNHAFKTQLCNCRCELIRIHEFSGDREMAWKVALNSIPICEELYRANTEDDEIKLLLAKTYRRCGINAPYEQSPDFYAKAAELLSASAETNLEHRIELAWTYDSWGVSGSDPQYPQQNKPNNTKALELMRTVVAEAPTPQNRLLLCNIRNNLAAELFPGNSARATELIRQSQAELQALVEAFPDNPDNLCFFAYSSVNFALAINKQFLLAGKTGESPFEALQMSLDAVQSYFKKFPEHKEPQLVRAAFLNAIKMVSHCDRKQAIKGVQWANTYIELLESNAVDFGTEQTAQLAKAYNALFDICASVGDIDGEGRAQAKVLELTANPVAGWEDYDRVSLRGDVVTICSDLNFNPQLAIEACQSAATQFDNENTYGNLGLAYFRAGIWNESVKAYERCNKDLLKNGGPWLDTHGFCFARALHEIGRTHEARQWLAVSIYNRKERMGWAAVPHVAEQMINEVIEFFATMDTLKVDNSANGQPK